MYDNPMHPLSFSRKMLLINRGYYKFMQHSFISGLLTNSAIINNILSVQGTNTPGVVLKSNDLMSPTFKL